MDRDGRFRGFGDGEIEEDGRGLSLNLVSFKSPLNKLGKS